VDYGFASYDTDFMVGGIGEFLADNTTTYPIILTDLFDAGCTASTNTTAQASCSNGGPDPTGTTDLPLTVVSNGPVCPGERLLVNAQLGSIEFGDQYTYEWSTPMGSFSTMNLAKTDFLAADAGLYSVTVTKIGTCERSVGSVTVATSTDCSNDCVSFEFVYLNDASNDITHKFQVMPDGRLVEVGNPWLADR